jgi:hypothetical protein
MSRIINIVLLPLVCLPLLAGCSKKKAIEAPDAAVPPPPQVVTEHPPAPQLAAVPIVNPAVTDAADPRPISERIAEKNLAPGVAIQMLRIEPPTQEELSAQNLAHLPEATRRAVITYRKVLDKVPELRCCPEPDPNQKPVDEMEMARKLIEEERKKKKGK